MNITVSQWRLSEDVDCHCCKEVFSLLSLAINKSNGDWALVSKLGCYGGEELVFNPKHELEKARDFIKTYFEEGILDHITGQEVLARLERLA